MQQPTNRQTPPTFNPTRQTKRKPAWFGRVVLVLLLAVFGAVIWQRTAIGDWFRLYGYHPSAAITALADETTMTPDARHLFYINRPAIDDKTMFASKCTTQEKAIVLGCYHDGENGIYILSISSKSELNGVMQVTAAHEMLHAAYARLSTSEKTKIDRELQDYYDHGLTDKSIKADVDSYRSSEPGQLLNEMHSIFGTEVAKLPAPLEQYYSRYFTNRQAVVKQAEKYEAAFRSRETAVKHYDTQLTSLKTTIKKEQSDLSKKGAKLDSQRAQVDRYRAQRNYSAYNAGVVSYNALVNQYNDELAQLKSDIHAYNDIVNKRNALVLEEQELVQELNGNLPAAK
jgi:hypothetical protein